MGVRGTDKRIVARTRKERARNARLAKLFAFVILLFAAFSVGFVVRGNSLLLANLGFPTSVTGISPANVESLTTKDAYNSVSGRIGEIEDLLATDSLDSYSIDSATAAAIGGFTEATADPYLRYYTAARYEQLLSTDTTGYAGIGVLFSEYNGQAYAVDVFENSIAQLNGVKEGDFVVAIDADRSQDWSRSEVVAALNREGGSSVVVTWRRPATLESDGGEEFTTTLECSTYDVSNVTTELSDEVGYVRLKQFTNNSANLVEQALVELRSSGAEAFVLDVRDNPGGFLTQAVDVASLFMSSGAVVEVQTAGALTVKSTSGKAVTDKPLVVLVNKNTAASAEVLVAALKESQRATVVGATTLGKGSVQIVRELSFGGALRYTAAYYLTPQGHDIDRVGVSPDVSVSNSENGESDQQKSYALEAAANLIPD